MKTKVVVHFVIVVITMIFNFSLIVGAQTRVTSEFLRKTADSLSILIAQDAKLGIVSCSEIDAAGKSESWQYIYISFATLKEIHFSTKNNEVIYDGLFELKSGIGVLVSPWINSDSALSIAEMNGGEDIRKQFPSCTYSASLFRAGSPPFLCYWKIEYKLFDETRTIYINAEDGIVVSVNDNSYLGNPEFFKLYQNFPNPFNPETTISFDLFQSTFVTLKIIDSVGKEVETIISEELPPGIYNRMWNASRLSSGVYFYQLQTNSKKSTKKLLMIK